MKAFYQIELSFCLGSFLRLIYLCAPCFWHKFRHISRQSTAIICEKPANNCGNVRKAHSFWIQPSVKTNLEKSCLAAFGEPPGGPRGAAPCAPATICFVKNENGFKRAVFVFQKTKSACGLRPTRFSLFAFIFFQTTERTKTQFARKHNIGVFNTK